MEYPQEAGDWTCRPKCINTPSVPPVLHTTRESRAQARKHYNLKFSAPIPLASDLEHPRRRTSVWNGGIFSTPGIFVNVNTDRICLLEPEVRLLGQQKESEAYAYLFNFQNVQLSGFAEFIKEAAANGTKYLGLMGPRDELYNVVSYTRHYASTIPRNIGAWDSPAFSNTSLEDVLFFTRPEDLDIPKTRGTWRIDVPYYRAPLENLEDGGAGKDAGTLLACAKEGLWSSTFNGRVVEYQPREGEKKWPNITYTLIE
jgi:hypothetical protein